MFRGSFQATNVNTSQRLPRKETADHRKGVILTSTRCQERKTERDSVLGTRVHVAYLGERKEDNLVKRENVCVSLEIKVVIHIGRKKERAKARWTGKTSFRCWLVSKEPKKTCSELNWLNEMSTQAYYKERLGFDPADTVAEHHREQRSQHGYEESLSKFKGQNENGFSWMMEGRENWRVEGATEHRSGSTQAFWGCWAMFIEAHGRWRVGMPMLDPVQYLAPDPPRPANRNFFFNCPEHTFFYFLSFSYFSFFLYRLRFGFSFGLCRPRIETNRHEIASPTCDSPSSLPLNIPRSERDSAC